MGYDKLLIKQLVMTLVGGAILIGCKIDDNSLLSDSDGSSGPLTISSGPTHDYGMIATDSTSDHEFTVTNNSDLSLTGLSGSVGTSSFAFKGGSYPGTGGTCGTSLAAGGGTCTIVVTYTPSTLETHSGTIEMSYADGDTTRTVSRAMTGQGKAIFDKTIPFDLNGDASGNGHSCAVTTSKNVACSGWNDDGQLGLNDLVNRSKPELVLGGVQGGALLSNVVQVAVGRDNSCAVTTGGDIYCWGLGNYNGTGATTTSSSTPVRVVTGDQADPSGYLTGISSVTMGFNYTCALTTTGDVYCWGVGTNGRLGYNSSTTTNYPKRVVGGEQGGMYLSNISSINAGRATTCAVTTGGDVYCWGDRRGAGIGTTGNQLTPARTLSGAQGGGTYLSGVTSVEVGWNRTCALSSGNVYCWGDGSVNALGHGILEQVLIPVKVLGGEQGGSYLENITKLSKGFWDVCAISSTNELYCWGANHDSTPGRMVDSDSVPISDAAMVTAGAGSNCYTRTNGVAYCWGYNYMGQLGHNGSASYFSTMQKVLTDLIQ